MFVTIWLDMQIYFVASSRLVGKDKELYSLMYKTISTEHKMVSDKVWKWVKSGVEDLRGDPQAKKENYNETLKCINKADIVIMEISGHSMSMGYILSKALEINKPVIAMYKEDMEPVFIAGMDDPKLILAKYTQPNVEKTIWESIKKAKSLIDVRFNFFVSPKILTYLDWVGQKRMIPKSVFLRNLIEREMKKDRDFKG
jgi:hypothetical protein